MSLYSYIAFPRSVDKSCLKEKFDKSKAFTVGEIRGTNLEKQIKGGISNLLPDNVTVYLGDMADFLGMSILDKHDVSFNGIFKNEYIYQLEARFNFFDLEEHKRIGMEIYHNSTEAQRGGQTEAEFMEYLIKENNDITGRATLCRQQLYDMVQLNAKPGEIVEIYSTWVNHISDISFGPPSEVKKIDAENVTTSNMLDLQENMKLEICRTV